MRKRCGAENLNGDTVNNFPVKNNVDDARLASSLYFCLFVFFRTPMQPTASPLKPGRFHVVRELCKHDIVARLKRMGLYADCGYLYVITNPLWPVDTFKIGRCTDLRQRFNGYNASQPMPIEPRLILVCSDAVLLEEHLKRRIVPHLFDPDKTEWLRMREEALLELVWALVEPDRALSAEFKLPVYRARPDDCSKCACALAGSEERLPMSTDGQPCIRQPSVAQSSVPAADHSPSTSNVRDAAGSATPPERSKSSLSWPSIVSTYIPSHAPNTRHKRARSGR